ncbi:MAG: tryptophan-rich sensory protein [Candidatus Bathyarchaeota archaeon]|nr:tryptophan-rich sensory protein [Candidatus Bathyarchaeota archaeon]
MPTKHTVLLQAANVCAFAATLIVNGLASAAVIGGISTATVSDQNPTLITPAGYVFSIWGIIYTLLAVFAAYQVLPRQREKPFLHKISWLFVLSSICNIIWIFLWQYNYIALSTVPMFALLATLAAIYLRLNTVKPAPSMKERLFVRLPFSVYVGWITVASAANVAVTLYDQGIVGWTSADAPLAIIAVAVVLAVTMVVLAVKKDVAYALVIVWALLGIAAKQTDVPDVVLTAQVGAAVAGVAIAVTVLRVIWEKRSRKTSFGL